MNNQVLSFYGKQTQCGNDFIQFDKLDTGRIKGLVDYDHAGWVDTIPPPPPPPHEPFRREYLIISKDSLKLVYEGY